MVWPKASTLHHIVKIWHGPRSQGKQSHSYRHDNPRACILPSRTRGHRLDLFGSKVKSFATHKKIMVIQNWVFGKGFLKNEWNYPVTSMKIADCMCHQRKNYKYYTLENVYLLPWVWKLPKFDEIGSDINEHTGFFVCLDFCFVGWLVVGYCV